MSRSWQGFHQFASSSNLGFSGIDSETQPPSQFPDFFDSEFPNLTNVPESFAGPSHQPQPQPQHQPQHQPQQQPQNVQQEEINPLHYMTLEDLLRAPGRQALKMLHPKRQNGGCWFKFDKSVTRTIKKIVEHDYKEAAPNWTLLSGDAKERWFKAFVQKYNWDEAHTTLVREEFDDICSTRLKDNVYSWKQKWINGKDKPRWMLDSVWLGLIQYWEDENNKIRAAKMAVNRKSERDGLGYAVHTCGSAPFLRKMEAMRDPVTGEYPDMVTFMEATHKRKSDGVIIDGKAKHIIGRCRELEQEKITQVTQNEDAPDDYQLTQKEKNEIYFKEVEVKNGRRYGLGSLSQYMDVDNAGSSSQWFGNYEDKYKETQAQLHDTRTELHDTRNELATAQQQIKELNDKMGVVQQWVEMMQQRNSPDANPNINLNL